MHAEWGDADPVGISLSQVNWDDDDALLRLRGVVNPDKLRMLLEAVKSIKAFAENDKPIVTLDSSPIFSSIQYQS